MASKSSASVDTPRELKFLCTYGGETKIVTVDANITYSSLISELSTRCANGSSISFKYQLPGKEETSISVTSDYDLNLMKREYQEHMKLDLSTTNQPAASSGSKSSVPSGSISQSKIKLVNKTSLRLEFWECPGSGLPEKNLETVEPNETKETEKKKFQSRFKQTQDIATIIAIRGGKSEEFCQPEDFSNFKMLVFTLGDHSNLVVEKSR